MDQPTSLSELVRLHQQGDPEAASKVFGYYAERLSRLAEQHLSRKLSSRVDGEDVVQSAFRTFFRRIARREFKIDSSAQLWQLLVKITLRKARAHARRHTAAQRDVGMEQGGADEEWVAAAVAHEPGPDEAAILADEIEALVRDLPPLYAQVLELRLQGCAVADIASQLGLTRQAVYRAIELLQHQLTRRLCT